MAELEPVYASHCMTSCEFHSALLLPINVNFTCRQNTTESQRKGQEDDLITIVRVSLVDHESDVRAAAAQAFDTLQEHLGTKAIDQTIPTLLEALRQPGKNSGTALQALREVMSVSLSKTVHLSI